MQMGESGGLGVSQLSSPCSAPPETSTPRPPFRSCPQGPAAGPGPPAQSPLPHLCPGHPSEGTRHPSPQPGALLLRPRRPSPRAPAFPKGWGLASFPLSLVSLRADQERRGGDEDRPLNTPPAGCPAPSEAPPEPPSRNPLMARCVLRRP